MRQSGASASSILFGKAGPCRVRHIHRRRCFASLQSKDEFAPVKIGPLSATIQEFAGGRYEALLDTVSGLGLLFKTIPNKTEYIRVKVLLCCGDRRFI